MKLKKQLPVYECFSNVGSIDIMEQIEAISRVNFLCAYIVSDFTRKLKRISIKYLLLVQNASFLFCHRGL